MGDGGHAPRDRAGGGRLRVHGPLTAIGLSAAAPAPGYAILAATLVLASALAAIAVWDARTMRIPDFLSLPLIAAGLAAAALLQLPVTERLIGAAAGYAVLAGAAILYKRLRGRDGLGLGDAKLLAAGGAWLGWTALPFILLVASFTGLAHALTLGVLRFRSASRPAHAALGDMALPFGPHLALAVFAVWITGVYVARTV